MKIFNHILVVGFLLFFIPHASLMPAASVKLPGKLSHFVSYLKTYSAAEENLIYYLNETLLFEQMPSFEEIRALYLQNVTKKRLKEYLYPRIRKGYNNFLKMTLTHRIKKIFSSHREIKKYLVNLTGDHTKTISLDIKHPQEHVVAELLLKRMGLRLKTGSNGRYRLLEYYEPPNVKTNHYYQILGFFTWKLENIINKTHRFELKIKEFEVTLPWDFGFLNEITGLEITPDSFAEILSENQKLQLLLGILYRLSDSEIDYINQLEQNLNGWKKMYANDKFLCGMFVLSHALRVKNNRLLLPGSPAPQAARSWEELAGMDHLQNPLKFLEQLAMKDEGKLNYFYTFSFFLPGDTQKVLFKFPPQKLGEIYRLLKLDKAEKIRGLKIPGLKDFGFFTLLYALKIQKGEIYFPGGIDAWAKAIGTSENTPFGLLKYLLKTAKKKNSLKRFISIYAKFYHRRELLTEKVIRTLYKNYPKYNVLVDFIEKIPIKKPQTVLKLFSWAKSFKKLSIPKREKSALIAIFQSLLEILCQNAKYRPGQHRYDRLIEELTQIPLSGASAYDAIFRFLKNRLGMDLSPTRADRSFLNFLLPNAHPEVVVRGQRYTFEASEIIKAEIKKVLANQSAAGLSQLVKINRLLASIQKSSPSQGHREIGERLIAAFQQLPLPEEPDEELPFSLKRFLETYSSDRLFRNLNRLILKKGKKAPQPEIDALIRKIKTDCLLLELKHYLVTCIYAVSIKSSKLQAFLNPNLTRFHDFSSHLGKTPWNSSGISKKIGETTGYHLEGGLSRLNITLAEPFSEYMFGREIGYLPTQGVPIIFNHLDLFPHPMIRRAQEYTGLLVKFAEELVQKSQKNPALRQELRNKLMTMTAGYHYRTIMERLDGKKEPPLYFSELLRLGEGFFKKKKFTGEFSQKEQLDAFRKPLLLKSVRQEMNRLGCIYYHTFGTLKPYRFALFPQPLSLLFSSRWTCAEMIDELKVKAAYISHLRQMPAQLLGGIVYRYLFIGSSLFFRDPNIDYHKTYFFYNVFNYLYLNQVYNEFRRKGVLKIK